MKRVLLVVPFVLAACADVSTQPKEGVAQVAARRSATAATCLAPVGNPRVITEVSRGFDVLGYNRCAGLFSGPADGVDGAIDGAVWGDATYAKDHLVMKWNSEWDRGNAEGWKKPPYAAWEDNEWNGKVPGGSGETWHYKIVWTDCDGSCLWGQFEVILSHGTVLNQHLWDVHIKPAGYGVQFRNPAP